MDRVKMIRFLQGHSFTSPDQAGTGTRNVSDDWQIANRGCKIRISKVSIL